MSLRIRVNIDVRAALLAGLTLREWEEMEIEPSQFDAELWPKIVEQLELTTTPATLRLYTLPANTPEAITEAAQKQIAEDEAKAQERKEQPQNFLAEYRAEWEALTAQPALLRAENGDAWEMSVASGSGIVISEGGINVKPPSDYWVVNYCDPAIVATIKSEFAPKLAALEAEAERHNRALFERELPAVLAKMEQEKAERAAKEAEEKAAKEERIKARAAERLATGYWERETDSYNERRYSAPWCAKVSFPSGAKPHYDFGDSTGKWGKPGLLRVDCKPGEIVAWGQKDLRRSNNSTHHILHMQEDGRMVEIDKTEAFRISQGK